MTKTKDFVSYVKLMQPNNIITTREVFEPAHKAIYSNTQSYSIISIITQDDDTNEDWLNYVNTLKFSEKNSVEHLDEFISALPKSLASCRRVHLALSKIEESIKQYISEMSDEDSEEMKYPSSSSLHELFRYIPSIPISGCDYYIESSSGYFGVSLKEKRSRLNFTIKDNREIIYSMVKRGAGLVKITGRGYITDSSDYREIEKIIGLLDHG